MLRPPPLIYCIVNRVQVAIFAAKQRTFGGGLLPVAIGLQTHYTENGCVEHSIKLQFLPWCMMAIFFLYQTKSSCEQLILGNTCIPGAQEPAQLSRLLDVLPSLCENAVNSGLT